MKLSAPSGLALVVLFAAQTASAQSVVDVVNNACATHPSLEQSRLVIARAEEEVTEARSTVLPRVNSVFSAGLADDDAGTAGVMGGVGPLNNSRPVSAQLSLTQPIYLAGRGRATIAGAQTRTRTETHRARARLLETQMDAVRAYVAVAQAQARFDVRRQNVDALVKQRDNAEKRLELGAGTRSDIVQAQSRISQGEAELVATQNAIRQAFVSLREASGYPTFGRLTETTPAVVDLNLGEALQTAVKNNPSALLSLSLIEEADQNIVIARSERSPTVSLAGSLDVQRDTAFNGFERDEGSLRLQLNVPIFSGGALLSREKTAKLSRSIAQSQRDIVIRELREAVEAAWYRLDAAQDVIGINEQLVEAASAALVAVQKEAEAGFRPNVDVLNANQEVLNARLALTDSRFDLMLASYEYLATIGVLDGPQFATCSQIIDFVPIDAQDDGTATRTNPRWIPRLPISSTEPRKKRGPRGRR